MISEYELLEGSYFLIDICLPNSRLTSTTVASPGCSAKRDGLIAKGGSSEEYVLVTD